MRILGFIIGIASLLYFAIYAIFAGLTNKFTYIWLLLGVFCIVLAGFWPRIQKYVSAAPKTLKIMVAVVLGICILAVGVAEYIIISYGISEPKQGAEYMIVLGAQVRGRTPSYSLARRLDTAYEYLEANPETIAILSGGMGEGEEITEAEAMAEYLVDMGISKERLLLEEQSRDTYENILFSREMMENQNARVVLVTNNFHVFRSVRIAQKQGLTNVEGMGAPVMWYTIPNLYLREAVAVIKYALCGQI